MQRRYYSSAAFVQVSAKTRQPEFGGAKSDVGSTITSVLEVAESDFTQMSRRAQLERRVPIEKFQTKIGATLLMDIF